MICTITILLKLDIQTTGEFYRRNLSLKVKLCVNSQHKMPSQFLLDVNLCYFLFLFFTYTVSNSPDLGDGGVEDVPNVTRRRFVPLAEGKRVGIQSTLYSLGLGPGQGGQQHCVVYILAVLTDQV